MDLRGRITATELAEIFQLLTTTRKEGTLTVSDGTRKKSIYFSRDGVTLLFDKDKRARSLGQLLVDYGRITDDQLQAALAQQRDSGARLGEVVREMGLVTEEEIEDLVRAQIEEEIFELLSWRGGTFHFRDEPAPEVLADTSRSYTSLMFDPNSLLMEAARRMDEWERIGELIRTGQEVFRPVEGVEVEVEEELEGAHDRVLPLVDGSRTAEGVFREAKLPKFEVYSVLYQLHEAGAAERVAPEELSRRAIEAIESGELDRGVSLLESALAQAPGNLEFGKNLGKAYDISGERERALELYAGVVSEYLRRGGPSEARSVLDRMGEMSPETPMVLALETSLALAQGSLGEAVQHCLSLVRAARQQQQYEQAMTVIEDVLVAAPEHAELREAVADMLAAAGESRRAIHEYERVGELYMARGRSYYARGVYQRILELDPNHAGAGRQLDALAPALETRARRQTLVVGGVVAAVLVAALGWWWLGRGPAGGGSEPVHPDGPGVSPDGPSPGVQPADVRRARARRLGREAKELESAGKISEAVERWEEAASLVPAGEEADEYRGEATRLGRLLKEARAQFERAQALEQQGSYAQAHREYLKLCVRYDFAVAEFGVALPVPVRTVPKGAQVLVDGELEGTTPLVLHLPPYKQVTLLLEHPGHERFQTSLSGDTVSAVDEVLPRQSRWFYPLRAGLTAGPCADSERVFVVGGDRAVRALSAGDGDELWQAKLEGQVTAAPTLAGDVLVLAGRDGTVYGLEVATGEESWRFPATDAFKGSPRYLARRGLLFVGGLDKNIYCLDARTGKERWRFATSGNVEASPTVVGELVICGSLDGTLYALEGTTGELRWERPTGGAVATAVAVAEETAYVANLNSDVVACSLESGEIRWRYPSPERVATGVWVAGGSVCFGTARDEVVGLDAAEGGVSWRAEHKEDVVASLRSGGGRLWVGGGRGSLACLDGATGETLWKAEVQGSVDLPLWVGEEEVYAATASGVWCFDQ